MNGFHGQQTVVTSNEIMQMVCRRLAHVEISDQNSQNFITWKMPVLFRNQNCDSDRTLLFLGIIISQVYIFLLSLISSYFDTEKASLTL